jgi:hypothetical protein
MKLRTVLALLALSCSLVPMAEATAPKKSSVSNYQKAMAKARKTNNKRQTKVKLVNKGRVVRPSVRKPKK